MSILKEASGSFRGKYQVNAMNVCIILLDDKDTGVEHDGGQARSQTLDYRYLTSQHTMPYLSYGPLLQGPNALRPIIITE